MDKKWLLYAGIFLAGAMLGPKILSLPLLNKLPTVS
jgi:hypothetical protein